MLDWVREKLREQKASKMDQHPETSKDAVEAMCGNAADPTHKEATKRDKESKKKDSKNDTSNEDKMPQAF